MTKTDACRRCEGELVEGYSVDSALLSLLAQVWIPGKPKLRGGAIEMPSVTYARGLRLEAWRCAACGSVEWFAREKVRTRT